MNRQQALAALDEKDWEIIEAILDGLGDAYGGARASTAKGGWDGLCSRVRHVIASFEVERHEAIIPVLPMNAVTIRRELWHGDETTWQWFDESRVVASSTCPEWNRSRGIWMKPYDSKAESILAVNVRFDTRARAASLRRIAKEPLPPYEGVPRT